jgi:hypothetical protein
MRFKIAMAVFQLPHSFFVRFAAYDIGRVEPTDGMRPIWGYMIALVIGTIVVAAVPWISTGFLK